LFDWPPINIWARVVVCSILAAGKGRLLTRQLQPASTLGVSTVILVFGRRVKYAGGGRIQRITEGEPLPFADGWFDLVVTNQVIEHVPHLDFIIREIARVLRPGGTLIAVFPSKEVIFEPHIKAFFIHWLAARSRGQYWMLSLIYMLRHGGSVGGRSKWIAESVESMEQNLFYRPEAKVISTFASYFSILSRGEAAFMRDRLAKSKRLRFLAPIFASHRMDVILRVLCVRLANVVLVLRRN
jgi:SAM-dependent methyltransferase